MRVPPAPQIPSGNDKVDTRQGRHDPAGHRRPEELSTVTVSGASQPAFLRNWLIWTAGFLSFPLAGIAGAAVAGRVDSPLAALVGGAVAGLVIGTGQTWASRRRLDPRRWIPATAIGMGLGLLLGASVVDYRTAMADLALMGALTGIALGLAQALALPRETRFRWAWAACMPAMWALGWTVTGLSKVNVAEQFTNFGATGALTFSALSGILLHALLPYSDASWSEHPQVEAT